MTKFQLKIGKSWLSIDKTGFVCWVNTIKKNCYLIWKE